MHESVLPKLIIPGLSEIPQQATARWNKAVERNRKIIEERYPLSVITSEELEKRNSLETQIDAYFSAKLDSYHIPLTKRRPLPKTRYVEFTPQQLETNLKNKETYIGGIYHNRPHMISMPNNAPGDLLDMMFCVAHEKSHASTAKAAYLFFTQNGKFEKAVELGGMEVLGNHQEKASLLEECFAQIDATAIANTVLRDNLIDEYEMRQELLLAPEFQSLMHEEYPSFMKSYSKENIIPHIGLRTVNDSEMAEVHISTSFSEYLLGIKICEEVGKSLLDVKDFSSDTAIAAGFTYLDKTRYTRSNEAHRTITKVLGGRNARLLFSQPMHSDDTVTLIHQLFEV